MTTTDTRTAVQELVKRLLVEEHGPAAIGQRPTSSGLQVDRPADYLAGIETARRVAGAAETLMRDYALNARGEGASWAQIAPALGVDTEEGVDPAAEAFTWTAPNPSMRFDSITVSWTCASCQQRITDTGPYGGHPDDDETGHAPDCARHAVDIHAWKIRTGWDED